jgi:hypothetical protein
MMISTGNRELSMEKGEPLSVNILNGEGAWENFV